MDAVPRTRVLCVDDNRDVADSGAELLRIVGFDARVCYDGVSALVESENFLPDVCLLDLNMPGMQGDELAVRLREQAAGRPILIVAVTAMGNEESQQRTAAAGFQMHLIKPVDPCALVRILNDLERTLEIMQLHNPSLA